MEFAQIDSKYYCQIIFKAQSQSPRIKRYYERLICKHGFRKARGIMGHKFAVAVYYMLKMVKHLMNIDFQTLSFFNLIFISPNISNQSINFK